MSMTTPPVLPVRNATRRHRWKMMTPKQRVFAVINMAAAILYLLSVTIHDAVASLFRRKDR